MKLPANSLRSAAISRRFLLIDRDGTLIAEKHYLSDPAGVEVLPGVAQAIRLFKDAGWGVVVVTNQAGVGRGYYSYEDMTRVNDRVRELLNLDGAEIDAFYACPHAPNDDCECRKPKPGMVEQAVADFQFDPANAVVVGDKACDVDLGRNVGAKTVLVRTGYGRQEETTGDVHPDLVVNSLADLNPEAFSFSEGDLPLGKSHKLDRVGGEL